MVVRRAGLESLFPRGGRKGTFVQQPPSRWDQPSFVAPPGAGFGLQQPTVVRPTEKRIPAQMKEFFGEPIRPRPPIGGPDGPMPPRPPGESIQAKIRALRVQQMQLRTQIRRIEDQILSLTPPTKGYFMNYTGPGGPPPPPLNPPTIVRPPSIGPGTPIPQPPTPPTPWKPDPPWGG